MKNTKKEEDGCPFLGDFMATAGGDLELVKQHVLLFVCALIPKAMASTLAFFLHTSPSWLRERKVNRCGHSHVLLIRQVLCKHQAIRNKEGQKRKNSTQTKIKKNQNICQINGPLVRKSLFSLLSFINSIRRSKMMQTNNWFSDSELPVSIAIK